MSFPKFVAPFYKHQSTLKLKSVIPLPCPTKGIGPATLPLLQRAGVASAAIGRFKFGTTHPMHPTCVPRPHYWPIQNSNDQCALKTPNFFLRTFFSRTDLLYSIRPFYDTSLVRFLSGISFC